MEAAGAAVFVNVQKIYYPLLCILGIPGLYPALLFGARLGKCMTQFICHQLVSVFQKRSAS